MESKNEIDDVVKRLKELNIFVDYKERDTLTFYYERLFSMNFYDIITYVIVRHTINRNGTIKKARYYAKKKALFYINL